MATKQSEKTLLIVESPSKAKTIEKYLGKEYIVRASVGHVRDLPKSNKKAVDIAHGFTPHYEISVGKEQVVADLRALAKKAKEVILATDPDREGEAIAWHLVTLLKIPHAKRIVFHEITEAAIKEAVKHPRKVDDNLRKAQEARRVLDRLVGYDLSGLIWKKVRYGLSAGRVQSPALRILMEREREVRAFVPVTFWRIHANLKTKKGEPLELLADEEPRDKARGEFIVSAGERGPWTVDSVEESETKRAPRPPFTTSTLQQSSSTRLGMSPSRTMQTAQKLYEAGLITYMRTDSTTLSAGAMQAIKETIEKKFGPESAMTRTYKTKSKNAQEAHEAIRPTDPSKGNAGYSPEQKRLYRLIWQRTIASQMVDAKMMRTKLMVRIADGKNLPLFGANGSRLLEPGWLAADPEAQGEDVILPLLKQGDALTLEKIHAEQKETEPPPRYTEAGLVKELEKRGIGRPSTYASIIKTIQDRGYVDKQGKTLIPTDTGDVVSSFLEKHFPTYVGDSFTAEMEEKLDEISRGEREYSETLEAFYTPFHEEVESKDDIEKVTNMGEADASMKCPICEGAMIIKLSKSGKFLSCKRFPECNGARTIEGEALEGPKPTGEICPKCGKGELVERSGRFGKFISCGNYPKCKYIKNDESTKELNSTGVKCPSCDKGVIVARRGRFGPFFSCSNYPECKFIVKSKPTGNICSYVRDNGKPCGHLMMEGTKTIPERCSDKTCPMHNPQKIAKPE
jgi:DNA topoisomerase-1